MSNTLLNMSTTDRRHLTPAVPPELSDYIVDYLYDDRRTLKVCSLVCRSWLPGARYHLFQNIILHDTRLCAAFARLLQRSPVLGHYVRHLELVKFASPVPHQGGMTTIHSTTPGLANTFGELSQAQAHLASVLRHTHGLKSLALSRLSFDAPFGHLVRQAATAGAAAAAAAVTELTLSYCVFPTFGDFVSLVQSFPRLHSLDLLGVTWQQNHTRESDSGSASEAESGSESESESESASASAPQPRPYKPSLPLLRRLSLGKDVDTATVMGWLLAESLHEEIETFSVCCTSEKHVTAAGSFVRAIGPSLKHFDINWALQPSSRPSIAEDLQLGLCTELESLTLRFPIYFNSSVAWVTTLLSTLRSRQVRHFSMELRLLGGLDALDWKEAGQILSEEHFSKLDTVTFKVLVLPGIYMGVAEVKTLIRNRMSNFDDKGMIRFL